MAESFLNKAINFIAGTGDSDALSDRALLLKQTAKDLTQNKFGKFYRIRTEDADPSLAVYLFNVYRVVYPLQIFFKEPSVDAGIKQAIMKVYLDPEVLEILKNLSPEAVLERKRTTPAGELTRQMEEESVALASAFDKSRLMEADMCFNLICALKAFALFDFKTLLRKFDPDLLDGDFAAVPRFSAIKADILLKEISDFKALSEVLAPDDDWNSAMEILKTCNNGIPLLHREQWQALLLKLKELHDAKTLELIIRLLLKNPIWEGKPVFPNEQMTSIWMEEKQDEVHQLIKGIAEGRRHAQIAALVKAVFGGTDAMRLVNYTSEQSELLENKDLEGYIYADGLNYLYSFLLDYFNREIHDLCDLLLIRGQWTDVESSLQMSDACHEAAEVLGEITSLDETLSEEGDDGARLRGAVLRVERDRTQERYITSIVEHVNENALGIINRSVRALIIVGKHLKILFEDTQKKHPELIINWKELSGVSRNPLPPQISDAYKKINYFVQLMLLETHPVE